jgi:hypothetical protein
VAGGFAKGVQSDDEIAIDADPLAGVPATIGAGTIRPGADRGAYHRVAVAYTASTVRPVAPSLHGRGQGTRLKGLRIRQIGSQLLSKEPVRH